LTDADEELEPSPVDALQTAIIDNLYLYADKDEEPFMPFLPEFTMLVWNLLLKVTSLPKHDLLAVRGIKFLSMLVAKPMHKAMFSKTETLEEIISKIVIPNLMIREVSFMCL
jgi:exportin-2 (importin alpha re-exporter)